MEKIAAANGLTPEGAFEKVVTWLVTLLYQTGYLTIRSFRQFGDFRRFDLCIPNREVENSTHRSF